VNLVLDQSVVVPYKALPALAKDVVQKNQFARKREVLDVSDEDEEDEEEGHDHNDYDDLGNVRGTKTTENSKNTLMDFITNIVFE